MVKFCLIDREFHWKYLEETCCVKSCDETDGVFHISFIATLSNTLHKRQCGTCCSTSPIPGKFRLSPAQSGLNETLQTLTPFGALNKLKCCVEHTCLFTNEKSIILVTKTFSGCCCYCFKAQLKLIKASPGKKHTGTYVVSRILAGTENDLLLSSERGGACRYIQTHTVS